MKKGAYGVFVVLNVCNYRSAQITIRRIFVMIRSQFTAVYKIGDIVRIRYMPGHFICDSSL